MADKVRYVLDKMAVNFRQLQELNVFSADEVKQIIKKRTDFEYLLQRRQLNADDFTKYLQYELTLEKLQGIRVKVIEHADSREKLHQIRGIYASTIRHICYIFERATRRFPDEMNLWEEYISYLQSTKSNSLLTTVFGKAISLHPKYDDFWLQASIHELKANSNTHAARVLLQRGLRANAKSTKLWLRYFELELWNAMKVNERKKDLELEANEEVISDGAALVVFRHAMGALAMDAVLQMHLSCEGIANELSDKIAEELKNKFGTDCNLWRHLALVSLRRCLFNSEQKQNRQMHVIRQLAVDELVEKISDASALCLAVVKEGQRRCGDAMSAASVEVIEDLLLSAGFALRAQAGSGHSLKRKLADATDEESAGGDDSDADDAAVEDEVLRRVQFSCSSLEGHKSKDTLAQCMSSWLRILDNIRGTGLEGKVLRVRFLASLLASSLGLLEKLKKQVLCADRFLASLTVTLEVLCGGLRSSTCSKESRVAGASLVRQLRLVADAHKASRSSILTLLCNHAAVLLTPANDSAQELVMALREVMDLKDAHHLFRSIAECPLLCYEVSDKDWFNKHSDWLVLFVKYCRSCDAVEDAKINISAAYDWMNAVMKSKPQIYSAAAAAEVRAVVVDALFALHDGSAQQELLRIKSILEEITSDESAGKYLDMLEAVERRLGNHGAANHIRWKKAHQT